MLPNAIVLKISGDWLEWGVGWVIGGVVECWELLGYELSRVLGDDLINGLELVLEVGDVRVGVGMG